MRILIIDDRRRGTRAGVAPSVSGVEPEVGASQVREFNVPTPLPGDLPRIDLLERGGHEAAPVEADPSMLRDLMARVQELLARTRRPAEPETDWSAPRVSFGDVTLDLPSQSVLRAGRPIRVTQTEFRLLAALVRRGGSTATRDELRRDVWGADSKVSARVVDTHVARLRRKIEPDPKQPRHIITALAAGYRFQP